MALVAYGSSDESEEESEEATFTVTNKPSHRVRPAIDQQSYLGVVNPTPRLKTGVSLEYNEELSNKPWSRPTNQSRPILKSLPKPNQCTSASIDDMEQESDLVLEPNIFAFIPISKSSCSTMTKGTNINKSVSKKLSQPVKITLPSLSQFSEEEEEEPMKKKLKPSEKGSGLFAILPAPKNIKSREAQRPLLPHVLTKKVIPGTMLQKPSTHLKLATETKSSATHLLAGYDSEDDEEQDFFSLNTECKLPKEADNIDSSLASVLPEDDFGTIGPEMNHDQKPLDFHSEYHPSPWVSGPSVLEPQRETWQGSKEDCDGKLSSQGTSDHIPISKEDLQLDAEAMQRLCGRRSRKQQPVEFIEVNGREIMPDPNDWLVKQLSEEQPKMRSHSHKRNDGPTTQQRRKHQITYLAFQAKENELELKNQWSQNRMSRKQTQSKYGF